MPGNNSPKKWKRKSPSNSQKKTNNTKDTSNPTTPEEDNMSHQPAETPTTAISDVTDEKAYKNTPPTSQQTTTPTKKKQSNLDPSTSQTVETPTTSASPTVLQRKENKKKKKVTRDNQKTTVPTPTSPPLELKEVTLSESNEAHPLSSSSSSSSSSSFTSIDSITSNSTTHSSSFTSTSPAISSSSTVSLTPEEAILVTEEFEIPSSSSSSSSSANIGSATSNPTTHSSSSTSPAKSSSSIESSSVTEPLKTGGKTQLHPSPITISPTKINSSSSSSSPAIPLSSTGSSTSDATSSTSSEITNISESKKVIKPEPPQPSKTLSALKKEGQGRSLSSSSNLSSSSSPVSISTDSALLKFNPDSFTSVALTSLHTGSHEELRISSSSFANIGNTTSNSDSFTSPVYTPLSSTSSTSGTLTNYPTAGYSTYHSADPVEVEGDDEDEDDDDDDDDGDGDDYSYYTNSSLRTGALKKTPNNKRAQRSLSLISSSIPPIPSQTNTSNNPTDPIYLSTNPLPPLPTKSKNGSKRKDRSKTPYKTNFFGTSTKRQNSPLKRPLIRQTQTSDDDTHTKEVSCLNSKNIGAFFAVLLGGAGAVLVAMELVHNKNPIEAVAKLNQIISEHPVSTTLAFTLYAVLLFVAVWYARQEVKPEQQDNVDPTHGSGVAATIA